MPCFFKRLFLVWVACLLLVPSFLTYTKPVFAISSITFTESATINDPATKNDMFAIGPSRIGDINGDGYSDLLISSDQYLGSHGRLYGYFGGLTISSSPSPDLIIDYENTGSYFPNYEGDMGLADLNNDGYLDIVAGGMRYNSDIGRAYVFFGSSSLKGTKDATSADVKINGSASSRFGNSLAVGDFNGDGNKDLAISAYNVNGAVGAVYIFYGNGTTSFGTTPNVTLTVNGSLSFGGTVLRVGDFNGDGYDDILAEESFSSRSKIYIFFGGANMSTSYGVKFSGEALTDGLTRNAAAVGDINHDGYDDVCMGAYLNNTAASKAGRVYCFFGSSSLSGDKSVTSAGLIYSGAAAKDGFGRGAYLYDVNNDGNLDLIVGAYQQTPGSTNGYVNIYFGTGTTLDTTADLTINASDIGESGKTFGTAVLGGDIKNSGWPQLFITSAGAADSTGAKVHVLELNHGTPAITASVSGAGTTTPKVTGSASDSTSGYTISNVQWSTTKATYGSSGDNVWTNCTASDGSFNSSSEGFACSLSTQTNGSKTVYLRTVDQNGLYMSPKLYGNVNFTVDTAGPQEDWTNSNGDKISFVSVTPENGTYTDNTLPSFKFIKAGDGKTKITKYQVVLTNNLPPTDPNHLDNYTYLDNINPNPSHPESTQDSSGKANIGSITDRTRQEDDKDTYYEDYSITVTPKDQKTNPKALVPAAYKWRIRAIDENGATTDTSERILMVKTHNDVFSNTGTQMIPLSLTSLGYPLNISNLDPAHILSSYNIYTTTPVVSGITYSNYTVNLNLTDPKTNKIVLSKQTTSQNSRFNLNITNADKLITGEYTLKLSASNIDNYVELPSFNLVISRGGNGSSVKDVQAPMPTPIESGPTSLPTPAPAAKSVVIPSQPVPFSITSFLKNLLHF